jgi:TonB-linked SusC/RagA family outer membrane protein
MNKKLYLLKSGKKFTLLIVIMCFSFTTNLYGQQQTVSGSVSDVQSGETLPGVNILVKGTTTGTSTDSEGNFELTVESLQDTLVVSFIGYQTQEISINGQTEIDIEMQSQVFTGEEMVVVGYGTQRREDLTGSISEVSSADIEAQPVTRIDEALQGLSSGVQVIQNGGQPGGDITVRIRGTNSINAGSNPLFVIDGFPGGNLNSINPNDIESIQILKDASATAIYGSRGAGGVVLVTTKQGSIGETNIDVNVSYSIQNVGNELDLLNAEQYARLANEANSNIGQPSEFDNPGSLGAGTNWQDQIFRIGSRQDYQLSASGGSEDIQYRVSGSYVDQDGIIKESFFNRGQFRFNLNANISDKLTVGSNLSLSRIGQNQIGGRSVRNALLYLPTVGVRNQNGDYSDIQVPQLELENPVADIRERQVENNNFSGLGNLFANYSFSDNLEFRSSIGGNYRDIEDKVYIPTTLQAGRLSGGEGTVLNQKETQWVTENTLTFNGSLNELNDIELLAGYTLQKEGVDFVQAGASQFTNEQLGFNALSVGSVRGQPQTGVSESTLQSYLFRANYQFNDKYLLTATGRYDGSSKFGEGNRYGFFPSGSIGWRLSEESFLNDADFLGNLKLRASYGTTGNQDIGTYAALARLNPEQTVFGDQIVIGVEPAAVANPELKWEETSQLNIGVDATLFDGLISITSDYYLKKTSDLLLAVALPSQTGFQSTIRNVGDVQNRGLEIALELNARLGEVLWNSNFNMTKNINEVKNLGGNNDQIFPGTAVGGISSINDQTIIIKKGEPLGSFYGFTEDGLFQSQEEIQNSAQPNAEVGEPRFRDLNTDGIIDDGDKTIIGQGQPTLYGGFSNSFIYKQLQLQVQLTGSFGNDILNTSRLELESVNGAFNNLATVLDRWTPDNTDTDIPKAKASGYPYLVTSRFIEDGSYIRIQNVTLSYNIPQGLISENLRNSSVYLTATNLYTFTGYSGYDPEINLQGGSNVAYSVDYNPYPRARTFTLGLRIGL